MSGQSGVLSWHFGVVVVVVCFSFLKTINVYSRAFSVKYFGAQNKNAVVGIKAT